MFTIYDGRDHFYQWDIEQKLIVEDPTINEVHFCNRTDECSLVCDVYDEEGKRLVNVPNVLLQTDWNINVYAYCENYTKHSDVFRVKKRSKPADYMYTETEVKTWDELEQRVINLEENGVPSETIGSAIEKYFEDNPIPTVDLTDYATIEYVDNSVNSVDLSNYATKDELSDKVSSTQLEEATAQFVTEADVDEKIEAIEIPEVDLSGYALKTDIPDVSEFITAIPSEYVTETELNAKGYLTEHQSLDGYAKTEDIPDVSAFQTEEQVIALIGQSGGSGGGAEEVFVGTDQPTNADIKLWIDTDAESSFYTKDEINALIPSVEGLASEAYVQEQIKSIDIPDVDLTNYATKAEIPDVSGFALKSEIPSIEGLATVTYVNNLVGDIGTLLDAINGEVI